MPYHPEPSTNPPWTRTMLTDFFDMVISLCFARLVVTRTWATSYPASARRRGRAERVGGRQPRRGLVLALQQRQRAQAARVLRPPGRLGVVVLVLAARSRPSGFAILAP